MVQLVLAGNGYEEVGMEEVRSVRRLVEEHGRLGAIARHEDRLSTAAGIRLKLAASAFPSAPIGEQVLVRGDGEEVSLTSERRRR